LTIYKETINEMGTKFVKRRIQLPHFTNNRWKKFIYTANVKSILSVDKTAKKALNKVIDI